MKRQRLPILIYQHDNCASKTLVYYFLLVPRSFTLNFQETWIFTDRLLFVSRLNAQNSRFTFDFAQALKV